ncbi:uncharacterized protein LOC135502639 [Lineus longissimus]|uniref:uncharacterized protein LOC135502639 n=1 Tax=Lineus longissimus TaxID=88925 RepID=UPI00315CCD07
MVAVGYCTTSRAWKTIIFTGITIALVNANLFYTYRYHKEDVLGTDILRADVPESPFLEGLALGFQLGFGTLIPFVIIVISNLWIIITVHKANKERTTMEVAGSKGQKRRDKDTKYLTRMLILVCIAYVMCSIPYRMYDSVMNIPALKDIYNLEDPYWILRYGVEYWVLLEVWYQNYSVNFYLYCIGGGRKYRNDVRTVLKDLYLMIICRGRDTSPTSTLAKATRR